MEDICLVHQALCCLKWEQIDSSVRLFGKKLSMPVIINAITGGSESLAEINRHLARAARETGVAMAVGSQRIALQDSGAVASFTVVREENPDGVILANVSALTPTKEVERAVEMLAADAVQLHLNLPQELAMAEGDRDFSALCEQVARTGEKLAVPVMVKEVGFGISRETALKLQETGVTWLDVGGKGGTNFLAIERRRFPEGIGKIFSNWGITTAASLLEVRDTGLPYKLVASGGIKNGLDVAKTIALGADLAGMAGVLLKILLTQSYQNLVTRLHKCEQELKTAMMLTGAENLEQLGRVPAVITGATREWCVSRGIKWQRN